MYSIDFSDGWEPPVEIDPLGPSHAYKRSRGTNTTVQLYLYDPDLATHLSQ
jgi:hypothetical protein